MWRIAGRLGLYTGIQWSNPKMFQSAIPPQFIGSVFWYMLVRRLLVVRRSAFPSLVRGPGPPSPLTRTHSSFSHLSGACFLPFIYGFPLQDRKEKLKRCIIWLLMVCCCLSTFSTLPVVSVRSPLCAFGTVSLLYFVLSAGMMYRNRILVRGRGCSVGKGQKGMECLMADAEGCDGR